MTTSLSRPAATGDTERALRDMRYAREVVEPRLKHVVDRLAEPTRTIARYHFGWCDPNGTQRTRSPAGKFLRPALSLLSAQAVGAQQGDDAVLDAATAVELVHNFTLVHDDIMDGDTTRRHRETAWSLFGTPDALLAGDALLVLAGELLADHTALSGPAFAALREVVNGQTLDTAFEDRAAVSPDEYLTMVAGKTGALLGSSCRLGALAAGGSDRDALALADFGRSLGFAFQLVDDLIGMWGDPHVTGKSVYSDLRRRKKTLPVIHALAQSDRLRRLYAQTYLADHDLREAVLLIDEHGGRQWTNRQVHHHLDDARAALDALSLDTAVRARLIALVDLVQTRMP